MPFLETIVENHEPLSVAEAAARLGLTEDTLRKRIRKGKIRAEKSDRSWIVFLDGHEPGMSKQGESTRPGISRHVPRHENGHGESDLLIAQLQSEVVFLREQLREQLMVKDQQLVAKDEQIAQRDRDIQAWQEQARYKDLLIARLEDRLIQLPSPEEPEPTEQASEVREPGVAQAAGSENVVSRF